MLVGLPMGVVLLLPPELTAVVFAARGGITDVTRTSLGARTRKPPSGPRLLSFWVWSAEVHGIDPACRFTPVVSRGSAEPGELA